MTDRYGNTRVAKIRAAYNDLRAAIRSGDIEAAERALDRYTPWADCLYGGEQIAAAVKADSLRADDIEAALNALLKAERAKAYERAAVEISDYQAFTKYAQEPLTNEMCAAIRALAQEDGE